MVCGCNVPPDVHAYSPDIRFSDGDSGMFFLPTVRTGLAPCPGSLKRHIGSTLPVNVFKAMKYKLIICYFFRMSMVLFRFSQKNSGFTTNFKHIRLIFNMVKQAGGIICPSFTYT